MSAPSQGQLGLKGCGWRQSNRADQTYIEDMIDFIEVRLPSGDDVLVIHRVEKLEERIPSPLPGDFPLDFCRNSGIREQ